MEQYHQYLFKVTDSEATIDANGNWQGGEGTSTEYVCKCRFEVDGRGSEVGVGDGKQVAITGTVYTPATPTTIKACQEIVVTSDAEGQNIVRRLTVVSIDHGRLHNRIYCR